MALYSPDALAGKRILVTGGGTGLGKSVAGFLAKHGAHVQAVGDGCDYITGETICIDGGHHLAAPSTCTGLSKLSDDSWRKIREASLAATAASKARDSH